MPATDGPNRHTKWIFTVALGAIGSILVTLLVLAFVWPVATSNPRDLPLAISGPTEQVDALESALAENTDGLFAFVTVDDRDAAIAAIQAREVYGAILLTEDPEVLTATAANLSVAWALTPDRGHAEFRLSLEEARRSDHGKEDVLRGVPA